MESLKIVANPHLDCRTSAQRVLASRCGSTLWKTPQVEYERAYQMMCPRNKYLAALQGIPWLPLRTSHVVLSSNGMGDGVAHLDDLAISGVSQVGYWTVLCGGSWRTLLLRGSSQDSYAPAILLAPAERRTDNVLTWYIE
eukprot:2234672-Amphidinium_carterae.1